MADFFSKLKKNLDKGTAIVSAKSNTLIETNKLKSEINTVKKLKKDTLLELGQAVYEDGKEGVFTIESVEALITQISEAEVKILDLEAKIVKIQDEEKEKMADINAAEASVEDVVEDLGDEVSEAVESAEATVEDLQEDAQDLVADVAEGGEEAVEDISEVVESALDDVKDQF